MGLMMDELTKKRSSITIALLFL